MVQGHSCILHILDYLLTSMITSGQQSEHPLWSPKYAAHTSALHCCTSAVAKESSLKQTTCKIISTPICLKNQTKPKGTNTLNTLLLLILQVIAQACEKQLRIITLAAFPPALPKQFIAYPFN